MKRGGKGKPVEVGIDRLAADARCHGIPLKHDPTVHLAQAHGIGRRGWIGVSDAFFLLTGREQRAVLLHEEAHLRGHHLVKRLLFLPLFWTPWGMKLAVKQELEADAFAASCGFGAELLRVVRRYPSGHYYPDKNARIAHLEALIA